MLKSDKGKDRNKINKITLCARGVNIYPVGMVRTQILTHADLQSHHSKYALLS